MMQPSRQVGVVLSVLGAVVLVTYVVYSRNNAVAGHTRDLAEHGEPRNDADWMAFHEKLAEEAQQGRYDVILYGDSITESWRGTQHDRISSWAAANAAAFGIFFRSTWNVAALGIAGDRTEHLLWRLVNGELPRNRPSRVAAILIGTNNLGYAAAETPSGESVPEAVNAAVPRVVSDFRNILTLFHRKAPKTHVLLVGILPREEEEQPNDFTPAIAAINEQLEEYSRENKMTSYVNCGNSFLTADHSALIPDLMPDGLHPSGNGAATLAECVHGAINSILSN